MVEAIQTRRVIGINDPSITCVAYDAIGEQWVKRFMTHHSELDSLIAEQVEAAQIKETSHPVLEKLVCGCQINYRRIRHSITRHLSYG